MDAERVRQHNSEQRAYFEGAPKRTMLPSDTPYVRRHIDALLRFGALQPGERVLEVGCGMGRHTVPLSARGFRLEALDLSPVLLASLRAALPTDADVPLHCADIMQPLPGLAGRFDAVIGFFTLHHLHDIDGCMSAMARMLAPGGRVVFLEPNAWNPLYYAQILLTPGMSWTGDGGVAQMRPSVIFRALRNAGLVHPLVQRFGFFPPFIANSPWGARSERVLERFPPWRPLLPFQLFRADLP